MRNVKNGIVKKIAALALAVAGMGFASTSRADAQEVQCDAARIDCTYNQPVIPVRNVRGLSHESPNALRETMESVGTRIQAELEASPQWACTNVDLQKAMADVDAAEDRIRQSLSQLPDYQAAAAQTQAAHDLVASLRESGASIEEITAAAQSALDASKTLTEIERQMSANDPELLEARARLQEITAARQAMQAGVRAQLLNDPQWQQASRRLDRLQ